MFGRAIDCAALTALGAAVLYFLLLRLGLPIPLCCALAFAGAAWARRALGKLPRRYAATPAQAEAALFDIARMPDAAALEALQTLTGRAPLVPALRPPSAHLTAEGVFEIWRAHRDVEGLCVAATCPADPGAVRMAEALNVALIDGPALAQVIRRTGQFAPPEAPPPPLSTRLRRAYRAFIDRPASPKAALYGAGMLLMYFATGLRPYLPAALLVLFVTGSKWIRRRAPG